jgi:hypothetical protein
MNMGIRPSKIICKPYLCKRIYSSHDNGPRNKKAASEDAAFYLCVTAISL